ncbi:MAG: tRNA pseudouridine(13) synthase TruD [Gammaproteobacteria bacterium]|nr:tRNA pseudouridine(13) synthase TruD [Gammaproteobacteria bacterium]
MSDWRSLALTPPRATGAAAGTARIRSLPEDFEVHEELGFEPAGRGEHLLLQVRKRLANTAWVARDLARRAGVRHFDVGFAGLKDRHAVTTQWFTVPARGRRPADFAGMEGEGYVVIAAHAHARKLPRGALAGNRFRIVLREFSGEPETLAQRVAEVARCGVPNYFGPQRFGRDLANLRSDGEPPASREAQGYELSALRSLLFNALLAERVQRGDWTRLYVGERANLDGSNSSFVVEQLDATIATRLETLDIHPTGPLHGSGESGVSGEIAALEATVIGRFPHWAARLEADRVAAARRPLRVAVRDLMLEPGESADSAVLSFRLRPGSFATTVLRELVELAASSEAEDQND